MKTLFSITICFFISYQASSQSLITIKGHCGLYCKNIEQVKKQFGNQIKFYDFRSGETVASIGAQCANWEAMFASLSDSINFYLEDIDSTSLSEKQVSFAWKYYSDLKGSPLTSSYKIVVGNERSTNLPDSFLDKIIIINSFHEFSNQEQMLADIKKKLKPNGILYIDETIAIRIGELHNQCKKRIYADDEMIDIFKKNDLTYINGLEIHLGSSKRKHKIFAFRKE